jgi:hypothetical protein
LPTVSKTPVVLLAKFAASVVDTGGATCEYLYELKKNLNDSNVIFRGLGKAD